MGPRICFIFEPRTLGLTVLFLLDRSSLFLFDLKRVLIFCDEAGRGSQKKIEDFHMLPILPNFLQVRCRTCFWTGPNGRWVLCNQLCLSVLHKISYFPYFSDICCIKLQKKFMAKNWEKWAQICSNLGISVIFSTLYH